MAKKELFEIPVLGSVIRGLGAYSRRPRGQRAGRRSSAPCRFLESGGAVGIFPQGRATLGGDAQPQTGVALLASLAEGAGRACLRPR